MVSRYNAWQRYTTIQFITAGYYDAMHDSGILRYNA